MPAMAARRPMPHALDFPKPPALAGGVFTRRRISSSGTPARMYLAHTK